MYIIYRVSCRFESICQSKTEWPVDTWIELVKLFSENTFIKLIGKHLEWLSFFVCVLPHSQFWRAWPSALAGGSSCSRWEPPRWCPPTWSGNLKKVWHLDQLGLQILWLKKSYLRFILWFKTSKREDNYIIARQLKCSTRFFLLFLDLTWVLGGLI